LLVHALRKRLVEVMQLQICASACPLLLLPALPCLGMPQHLLDKLELTPHITWRRCEVKVIDLGSSCFISDHLSSYVQSRSYRAPEVILGLPYDQKIDIWSFGCILAELLTGSVLFQVPKAAIA